MANTISYQANQDIGEDFPTALSHIERWSPRIDRWTSVPSGEILHWSISPDNIITWCSARMRLWMDRCPTLILATRKRLVVEGDDFSQKIRHHGMLALSFNNSNRLLH